MAKRLNPRHQDMVRAKIQTTKLLQLLHKDATGEVVLRDGQRDSAKFLVNKSLANPPEQKDLTVSNPDGSPLAVEMHIVDHRPKG